MTVGLLRLPPLPLYTLFSHFIIHKFQLYKVTFRNVRFSFPFLSFLFSMYNTINIRNETFHLLIVSTILFVHSFRAIYFNYYSFRTENGNLDFSLIKFTKDPVSKNFDHGDEEFFFLSPSVSLEKISCFCFLFRLKPFSLQSPISRMREIRSFVADEPDGKILVNANQLSRLSAMSRHCTKSGSSVGDIANFLSFVFFCIFILSFHSCFSRNHCTVFATDQILPLPFRFVIPFFSFPFFFFIYLIYLRSK